MEQKKVYTITILGIILLDVVFIIFADLTSFIIRFNGIFPKLNFDAYLQLAFFIIIIRQASFYIFHLYERPKYKSNFEILINTIKATTFSSVIIIFVLYFLSIDAYPRWIAFLSWFITIIFISCWRFVIKEFIELYLGKDFLRAHLLIIGTGAEARELATHALRDAMINYKLVGFVMIEKKAQIDVNQYEVLGTIDDIPSIIKNLGVDEIIIADASFERRKIANLAPLLNQKNIVLKSAPSAYERVVTDIMLSNIEASFVGPTFLKKPSTWYWGLKRILDIIFSFVILISASPIMLSIALLIKISSQGPVLYFQKRVGQNGRHFIMYKFRTMYINAEKGRYPRWAKKGDVRITPIGKVLRRFRIDELPQLVNVLKNDMSLIGPRPERPYFTSKLMKTIPFYVQRLQVKPGISGWAQVNFKYADTAEDTKKKLLYDLFYIQNMSVAIDLFVAFKTFKVVITGRGAH